ncbi:exopolysaccharide biosynthesis polyprenyl glycosylphosphotransferase [Edaphobacter aggregans]|uniref:Exopolysaccharide biosynthesis polyprenyl glycosylphosphotransferase n=1 Tax=Edaphobacter aggregans TaxID=570835 RepID=A0A3R9Q981_9BACT|nr:sugar transferase [Edaphobacter aggregans]RSL15654.1 exopolysaccharide biosynthesis polyprenyl glycosylphosphotransferase [Edaphobacter aggregans]
MTPSNRKTLIELVKVCDIGILFCCLGVAYASVTSREIWSLLESLQTHRPIQIFLATGALIFAWHLSLKATGLYHSQRLKSLFQEVSNACSGITMAAASTFVWLLLIRSHSEHKMLEAFLTASLFALLTLVCIIVSRAGRRTVTRALRLHGYNLRHTLIVGTNQRASHFATELLRQPERGYTLQGFVDDHWWGEETRELYGAKLLGNFDDFPELLRTLPVDEVVVALPIATFYQQVASIVFLCQEHGILVRTTGTFFDFDHPHRRTLTQGINTAITLHDDSWDPWASLLKRIVDLTLSLALLFALLPLLVVIALLIKITSPGPVFFIQKRLGLGKNPFKIIKFRTMVADAESQINKVEHLNETSGPTFKVKNDPRITPLGKFLRKTSLDEIPQLLNVVMGNMSLVGPRPLPLRDYEGFSKDWHRRRFSVKPGITCLWQIMGRSSIAFEEWMALDMRYIDQWSVWLDIKILFQTIPAVFRGSGAV